MKCRIVKPWLVDYLENELGPDLTAKVETHLDECTVCRAELAGLREAREVLKQAGEAEIQEPPESFWLENIQAVAGLTWEKGAPGQSGKRAFLSFSAARYMAAAAVLVIALGWGLKWRLDRLKPAAQSATPVAMQVSEPQIAYADSLYKIAEAIYQLDLAAMALESANELGADQKSSDLSAGMLLPAGRTVYDGLWDLKDNQLQEVMLVLASN